MALFNLAGGADINAGVKEFESTEDAVLLDVRTVDEYAEGHIPGSINIPLDTVASVLERIPDKDTPLFVHCLSGGRSGKAVAFLKKLGYTQVKNIGGINLYNGPVER
ncbi:MAG: rhodanese-like domain-containing protein [Coriobacteriaceae bacterium]|nr:rhodanese-like domain-containing protein [Coriobacteriaceae bacterium]